MSLFGKSTGSSSTSKFSFGTTTSSTTKPTSSFSFGNSSATKTGTSSSLFGNSTTPKTGSLFGSSSTTTGGFGNFGSSQTQTQQTKPEWLSKLEDIGRAYDSTNAYFVFRFMLYNHVKNADQYKKPNDVPAKLWQQAVANNPDPEHLVPVEAKGFQSLKERVSIQDKATNEHIKKLEEIESILTKLQQKHEVSTLWRLEQYTKKHRELFRRTLHLMRKLELLASHGQGISADEEAFVRQIMDASSSLSRPDQFRGRLAVLSSAARATPSENNLPNYSIPDEVLEDVFSTLKHMNDGIKVLNQTLLKDVEDLQVLSSGMKELNRLNAPMNRN